MKISSSRHLTRRENLLLLIEEAKGASALALMCGTPKSHISAMQSGARGMGDALAEKLEKKMGKPPGWMDEAHGAAGTPDAEKAQYSHAEVLSPHEHDLVLAFRYLPEREQDELLRDVMSQAETYRDLVARELRKRGIEVNGYATAGRAAETLPAPPPAAPPGTDARPDREQFRKGATHPAKRSVK